MKHIHRNYYIEGKNLKKYAFFNQINFHVNFDFTEMFVAVKKRVS